MDFAELKKRKKIVTISTVIVAIALVFLLSYYAVHGFSLKDSIFFNNNDVRLNLDTPNEGQTFYKGDTLDVSGSMWGGIPDEVYVWDERYNVPVVCNVHASRFSVQLFPEELTDGSHTLCVQGQSNDGRWTAVQKVTINIDNPDTPQWTSTDSKTWSESILPEPISGVFRPAEEVVRQISVSVTGGTSGDDLNGDNIPDEIQQSPTTPRYNPMNVPLSAIIVFSLIIFVIILLIYYVVKPYLERKQKARRMLHQNKSWRNWQLKMKSLSDQSLRKKLDQEKRQRKELQKKIKEERQKRLAAQSKRPINIYMPSKKKVSTSNSNYAKIKRKGLWNKIKSKFNRS